MSYSIALLRPKPISTRLWQLGGLIASIVVTIAVANQFLSAERSVGGDMLGHDFLAFYTAGDAARTGNYRQLYDLPHADQFQHALGRQFDLDLGQSFGPYWNPPFYAWAFAPLSGLPYPYALATWIAINLLCAVGASAILCRFVLSAAHPWPVYETQSLRGFVQPWRYWMLVPMLLLVSMPFVQALSHGQNSMMSLLVLCATVALWRKNRPLLAGMACGLLFYKPQLAAVVAVMLTLTTGWRAMAGLAIVGTALLAMQELSMPGSTQLYLHQLPINLSTMQTESAYLWERHVTLKAFWRLLLQGRSVGPMYLPAVVAWAATSSLLFIALSAAVWNTWKTRIDDAFGGHTRAIQRDRIIAATIATMPLLMPFYFDYDLLLLAVPFTLMAVERMRRSNDVPERHDRALLLISGGLYCWLMINPGLAKDSGINVTVLFVASLAGLLISRACRENGAAAGEIRSAIESTEPKAVIARRRLAA